MSTLTDVKVVRYRVTPQLIQTFHYESGTSILFAGLHQTEVYSLYTSLYSETDISKLVIPVFHLFLCILYREGLSPLPTQNFREAKLEFVIKTKTKTKLCFI